MAKSISDKQKRVGRPATGITPYVGMRFPAKLLGEIDTWAKENHALTRSEAIRRLVEKALANENSNSTKRKSRP